jgi:hypothetical protein
MNINNEMFEEMEEKLTSKMNKSLVNQLKLNLNHNKEDYGYWWATLSNIFRQCGVLATVQADQTSEYMKKEQEYYLVQDIFTQSGDASLEESKAKEIEKVKQARTVIAKSRAAYTIMISVLEVRLFTAIKHIHKEGDAHNLLTVLRNKFEPNTNVTCFKALQLLLALRQQPNESMNELGNKIKGLGDEIARVPRNEHTIILLGLYLAISPQYQEVIKTKLYSDPSFTFDQALQLLNNEEDLRKLNSSNQSETIPTVNKALLIKTNNQDNSNSTNKHCAICDRSNHTTERCFLNLKNPRNRAGFKLNSYSNREQGSSKNESAYETTYVAHEARYRDSMGTSNDHAKLAATPMLFIDSGCTIHTCNDKRLLTNVRDISPHINVDVANGQSVEVNQVGEIQLDTNDSQQITLGFVAYSDKFISNLISVSELTKMGFTVSFGQEEACVKNHNDKAVLVAPKSNKLYQLEYKNADHYKAFIVFRNPDAHTSKVDEIRLLHYRTGHLNAQDLARLSTSKAVVGLGNLSVTDLNNIIKFECEDCAITKAHKVPFSQQSKQPRAAKVLERLHCDITGPIVVGDHPVESMDGNKYYSIMVDEYSGYISGKPMKVKSDTVHHVMNEMLRLERITESNVKYFHSDGGGEYHSNDFKEFLADRGITQTSTTRNTPQHNGTAERAIRTIFESARAMLAKAKLPLFFWPDAANTAVYLHNRRNLREAVNQTPLELVTGEKPSLAYLKVFGCDAFILNEADKLNKLEHKAAKGIMLGYDMRAKVYHIFHIDKFEVIRTHNVQFHENLFNHVDLLNRKLLQYRDKIYNSSDDYNYLSYQNQTEEEESTLNQILNKSRQVHLPQNQAAIASNDLVGQADSTDVNSNLEQNEAKSSAAAESSNDTHMRSVISKYQFDDPGHRETFMTNYIKPFASEKIKEEVRRLTATEPNKNIKWNKIHNNKDIFDKVCQQVYPNQFPSNVNSTDENKINPPADTRPSRERRSGISPAMVNYESSQELLRGGQDIFGDYINQRHAALSATAAVNRHKINDDILNHQPLQLNIDNGDPKAYSEALQSDKCQEWLEAMKAEMTALQENETFSLTLLPAGRQAIPCKWVYKTKCDENGNIIKYKARVVVKGFLQKEGRDYDETFAPVMKYTSLRILLAIATIQNLEIQQFDVDSAFLNAPLDKEVYMKQPEGFVHKGKEHLVWKLNKALYGLKQAPHVWNGDIDQTLTWIGFHKCVSDSCVYTKTSKTNKQIILGLFVDDVIIIYNKEDQGEWVKLKQQIQLKYKIKDLGDAKYILGMKITRDRTNRLLVLDQKAYIERILNRYNMLSVKIKTTPGTELAPLKYDEKVETFFGEKQNLYQQLTGSVLYPALCTRPDLAHAVGIVCRYNSNPQHVHMQAVKAIYRYLSGTKQVALRMDGTHMSNSNGPPIILAYTDSDWAGDPEKRKSTSGYVIKINNCPIQWISKKQNTVAKSSCEAEIIAAGEAVKEIIWINGFLIELKIYNEQTRSAAVVHCDNKSAIKNSQEDLANSKTKHIALNFHFIKQAHDEGLFQFEWIDSDHQQADIFTKPLGPTKFHKFQSMLMGEC